MYTINYCSLYIVLYILLGGRLDVLRCALLYWVQCHVVHCSSISNTFWGVEGWNVGKYFFFRAPFLLASDGGGSDELQCNSWVSSISSYPLFFPFPSPAEVPGVRTWRNFYLPRNMRLKLVENWKIEKKWRKNKFVVLICYKNCNISYISFFGGKWFNRI